MNIKTKVLSIIMVAETLCKALLSNPLPVHASSNPLGTKACYSYYGVSPYAGEQQFSNFINGQPVFWVESQCYSDCDSVEDIARYYVEEIGQLEEVPSNLQNYIDYQSLGRDMEIEGNYLVTSHCVFEYIG